MSFRFLKLQIYLNARILSAELRVEFHRKQVLKSYKIENKYTKKN